MNLKILFMLLIYYSILSALFLVGGSVFAEDFSSNIYLNDTLLVPPETDTGGLFATGISFGRFFTLVAFGLGLPLETPVWFVLFFAMWQTIISILAVGFVISSIWDG